VTAQDFILAPAMDPLRTRIPACDAPCAIEDKQGNIRDRFDQKLRIDGLRIGTVCRRSRIGHLISRDSQGSHHACSWGNR
jgi:hypothetical protein